MGAFGSPSTKVTNFTYYLLKKKTFLFFKKYLWLTYLLATLYEGRSERNAFSLFPRSYNK